MYMEVLEASSVVSGVACGSGGVDCKYWVSVGAGERRGYLEVQVVKQRVSGGAGAKLASCTHLLSFWYMDV